MESKNIKGLNIVWAVRDDNGDIEIYKSHDGKFRIGIEIKDAGPGQQTFWEMPDDTYKSLAHAVATVVEILKINLEHEFYHE